MKTLEIKATKRESLGKKSTKKLRKENNVPCVMYGGKENIHFYAHENEFRNLIYSHNVYLVKFNIDGTQSQAIVKEIQFHPVSDKILHIDFIEIFEDKETIVSIPIELTGNSKGILNGGKLRQRRRSLKVKGLVKNLPDVLEIDITELDIGESYKVRDLSFDNVELLDPGQVMVVGVVSSRIAAKGMIIEEPEVEGEEEAVEEGAEAPAEEGGEKAAEDKEKSAQAEKSEKE